MYTYYTQGEEEIKDANEENDDPSKTDDDDDEEADTEASTRVLGSSSDVVTSAAMSNTTTGGSSSEGQDDSSLSAGDNLGLSDNTDDLNSGPELSSLDAEEVRFSLGSNVYAN